MSRMYYDTKENHLRRQAKQDLRISWSVGLFLCLTIILAPIGLIVILVGQVEYAKNMKVIAQSERDVRTNNMVRGARSLP